MILVVYTSTYGNTKKIAETIASVGGSDARLVKASEATPELVKRAGLLIVGSATQGGRPMQELQSWLKKLPAMSLQNIRVAAFDTRIDVTGKNFWLKLLVRTIKYAAEKIEASLVKKGGQPAAEPAGFFVLDKEGPLKDGEIERAKEWAKGIIGQQKTES
ncbi:MAG: flavodoxin domain-containing protein [Patescibacteria group bacterium]